MNIVYLLLGANLGDPLRQLNSAHQQINESLGEVIAESAIYQSEAWGVEDQPIFYNQALAVKTGFGAKEALRICLQIENNLGRVRTEKWGARMIDIDILYFNTDIIESKELTVPHPYIHFRRFALVPLCEIAPTYIHPILQLSNAELLLKCTDKLAVTKLVS